MRIAFATAFAHSRGEGPRGVALFTRSAQRNFEFIHAPMKKAVAARVLDRQFDSRELALGFYGQLNCYLVIQWLMPDCRLNRQKAVRIVNLFPAGAAGKPRAA